MKKKNIFGILIALLVLLVGVGAGYALHSGDAILSGVKICGIGVGGMSAEEAVGLLTDSFPEPLTGDIVFTYEGHEATLSMEELSPELLIAETVQSAERYGKEGNIFTRLGDKFGALFGKADLPLQYAFSESRVRDAVSELKEYLKDAAVENDHYLDAEKSAIIIINGTKGNVFDREAYLRDFKNSIGYRTLEPITLSAIHQDSDHPSFKELVEVYGGEPTDATYEVVGFRVAYTEGTPGAILDKEKAKAVLDAHTSPGEEFSVPVTLKMPEVTAESLEEDLFGHKLSTYTTRFNTGDRGRSMNVALASEKINGTVLAPGAVFSYNEVVGERTSEQGFQIAKVYSGGKSVDGIGGGICQVSSTLYNTALYANLEIVSRRNHQLPVSYVPLGQDATVVYGATDFKFKNSTDHPIKITSSTYEGTLTVSICGTPYEKETVVTITNKTVGTIPYGSETVEDPTLPFGETRVEQRGANGYKVDTYIRVTEDGKEVRNEKISTSTYNAKKQITAVSSETQPLMSEMPAWEPGYFEEPIPVITPNPVITPDPVIPSDPVFLPSEDEFWGEEFE